MPLKQQELNAAMENDWAIGLTEAPCKEPKEFFIGLCCCPGWPCVAVYTQRKELLQVTGEPYVCCGGMFPCGPCKDPQDESCLFCEAGCCPYCGIVGNRYLVQTRFSVRNGACDEFILTFMCLVSWAICILETAGIDVPDEIEAAVDLLIDIIYACMHAQQHHQIQIVKRQAYRPPPPHVVVLLPPVQQDMIAKAKIVAQPGMPQPQMMGQPMPQQPSMYGYQGQGQQQMAAASRPGVGVGMGMAQQPTYYGGGGGYGGGQPQQMVFYQQPPAQQQMYAGGGPGMQPLGGRY